MTGTLTYHIKWCHMVQLSFQPYSTQQYESTAAQKAPL